MATRLAPYRQRRHFERTPEPQGEKTPVAESAGTFVVQKHAARNLHYDFRLELDGVLLSWSVPKGPSLHPGDRRLAVRTEDHPLEYANFEGIIPKGEYGGGTVIVWDRGTWQPEGDAHEGMQKGRLTFVLKGQKLHGRFHLVRTRLGAGKRENWLLFKGHDAADDADRADILSARPESALSGRTLEEVTEAPRRVWHSKEAEPRAAAARDVLTLVKQLSIGVPFTNLDKVLYPEQNLRKAELLAYYASVATYMLPHVSGRPLTLVRCPHGRMQKCFFQKHAKEGVPAAVQRIPIREDKGTETYMMVRDMPGLVALAQLGVLEVHTWTCHAAHLEAPDQLVFDLDPDEGLAWVRVVEAALEMRERLRELGLESFVKTTGGKGLHVVAPVTRKLSWDEHKQFAHELAQAMASAQPDRFLTNMRKDLRKNRIFIDYLRNGRGATAIAPYSTRARVGAPVATPVHWEELKDLKAPQELNLYTVLQRLDRDKVDAWQDYPKLKQSISASALRKLGIRQ